MSRSPADNHARSQQSRTVLLAADNKNSILTEIAGGEPNPIAYSVYGQQSAQREIATRLGFNGELRETRIGWYLLGNGYRAYNPTLMRFHSPDSWSPFGRGGLNPYMYVVGDPVNHSDPTGHALFPGIPKAITRPVNNFFNFFFGGSSVTGARKLTLAETSMRNGAIGGLGGLPGAESDGFAGAMINAGTYVGGAPGPRNGLPRQTHVEETVKHFPGYEGAPNAYRPSPQPGQTSGSSSGRSPPEQIGTRAGRDYVTIFYSDGSRLHRPRLRGGGDTTGFHPRTRMNDIQTRDRAFVQERNEVRRLALIGAMEQRNAQLRQAGLPQREIIIAMRREAPGMLRRINEQLR